MKSRISDRERLFHILEAIDSINEFTKDITYQEFNNDFKLRLALVKLLEIIGEAASGITEQSQSRFTEIEWAILKSVRNVLVHEYFGIDYDIIWNAIKERIPELKDKISGILDDL